MEMIQKSGLLSCMSILSLNDTICMPRSGQSRPLASKVYNLAVLYHLLTVLSSPILLQPTEEVCVPALPILQLRFPKSTVSFGSQKLAPTAIFCACGSQAPAWATDTPELVALRAAATFLDPRQPHLLRVRADLSVVDAFLLHSTSCISCRFAPHPSCCIR